MLNSNSLVTGGYPDKCVSVNTYILRLSDPDYPGTFYWAIGADLPTSRGGLMCSKVYTEVYGIRTQKVIVAGGEDGRSQSRFNIVEIYDVAGNKWETGKP